MRVYLTADSTEISENVCEVCGGSYTTIGMVPILMVRNGKGEDRCIGHTCHDCIALGPAALSKKVIERAENLRRQAALYRRAAVAMKTLQGWHDPAPWGKVA